MNIIGREDEFEETFGFPMYYITEDGKIEYNEEYLIVDFWCYVMYNGTNHYTDINEIGKGYGFSGSQIFSDYLKEYGVDCEVSTTKYTKNVVNEGDDYALCYNEYLELIKNNDNCQISISASNRWDLYDSDNNLFMSEDKIGSGHAMCITGVTESGDFIVSTWGEKMTLDAKSIGCYSFTIVSYD